MRRTATLVGLTFLLAACAGPLFVTEQQYAGISKWKVSPNVDCIKQAGESKQKALCYNLIVTDGKEKQDVTFEVSRDPVTGIFTVKYSATAVKAFEGQALRAEVEKEVIKALRDILPGMVDSLVRAVMDSINPIP